MFFLHSSNQTENLLAHLLTVMASSPLPSPFAQETFLIQSQGMERWLSQQLAQALGVWGNFAFLFPGKFFSSLAQAIDSRLNDAAFERHTMMWRLEKLLRQVSGEEFASVRDYLAGPDLAVKRYQLALQLAQLFDQYQMLRPDLLACWQQGGLMYHTEAERWQKSLWLSVLAQTGPQHRGSLWQAAVAKLQESPTGAYAGKLPGRVSVFGVNTLPPLFLHFLQGLAQHTEVHLFLLNPSRDFWADLPAKRAALRTESTLSEGHPLLISLGQQGRDFQAVLLEAALPFTLELDSFEATVGQTLLQQLQNDILDNCRQPKDFTARHDDVSLRVHACHSRLREVQVLKNELLQALADDPTLALRDIVVMAPDIQSYEPFIAAVFQGIQHAVADRSLRLANPALDAFIVFLSVSQSRFGWQAVLDLLTRPVVYPGFGLNEADLALIRHWLLDTRVRWGKSAAHKQALGLPPVAEHTWQSVLERLLLGYALDSEEFCLDILPYRDIEGSSAQALGGLVDYLELLCRASEELAQPRSLRDWSTVLYRYADALLAAADPVDREQLNLLLADLAETYGEVHDAPVELAVLRRWLEGAVAERKSSHGFLRGQLTFCSMLPMRSIPFKVIALLGMNQGEFPKIDRPPSFDLLSQYFRKGDRSRRADDRYQFLEILLSARQRLVITYLGQGAASQADIPPSVVVGELLEVLAAHYQATGCVIKHPLQPFSGRYFVPGGPLFSYAAADAQAAQQLAARNAAPVVTTRWWQGETPAETPKIIELADLLAFFQHPQRFFFRQQLAVQLGGLAEDPEEREPFALSAGELYPLHQAWVAAHWQATDFSVRKLKAQGCWLPGALGELAFGQTQAEIARFVGVIDNLAVGEPLPSEAVDIQIGPYRVMGVLGHRYRNGGLIYRYAKLKGKDFLNAWLQHLVANRIADASTHLLASDGYWRFEPQDCLPDSLGQWLDLFVMGQRQPAVFFPEAALAYVRQADKLRTSARAEKSALQAAQAQLVQAVASDYEWELARLFGGQDAGQILGEAFAACCEALLLPVWSAQRHRF